MVFNFNVVASGLPGVSPPEQKSALSIAPTLYTVTKNQETNTNSTNKGRIIQALRQVRGRQEVLVQEKMAPTRRRKEREQKERTYPSI